MKSILFDVLHNVTLLMAGFYLLGKLSPLQSPVIPTSDARVVWSCPKCHLFITHADDD